MSDDHPKSVDATKRCSKCGGEMAQGFVADWFGFDGARVAGWYPGAPTEEKRKQWGYSNH